LRTYREVQNHGGVDRSPHSVDFNSASRLVRLSSIAEIVDVISKLGVSVLLTLFCPLVATMKYDLRSLKYIMSGAAPLGGALVNAFSNKLKSVGVDCSISQGLFFFFFILYK
jgi:hypothetical protein